MKSFIRWFGGKIGSYGYAPSRSTPFRSSFIPRHLLAVHKRLQHVYIENLDIVDLIDRYDQPDTFFFLDPPYIDFNIYKHNFTDMDHIRLANRLKKLKGKFILTINICPKVNDFYDDFIHTEYKLRYGLNGKNGTELFVSNFKIDV